MLELTIDDGVSSPATGPSSKSLHGDWTNWWGLIAIAWYASCLANWPAKMVLAVRHLSVSLHSHPHVRQLWKQAVAGVVLWLEAPILSCMTCHPTTNTTLDHMTTLREPSFSAI